MTTQDVINQILDLLEQQKDINEQVKALKDAATEKGFNFKALKAVATALHSDKLPNFQDYISDVEDALNVVGK